MSNRENVHPCGCEDIEKGLCLLCSAIRAMEVGVRNIERRNLRGGHEHIMHGICKSEEGLMCVEVGLRQLVGHICPHLARAVRAHIAEARKCIAKVACGLEWVCHGQSEKGIECICRGIEALEHCRKCICECLKEVCRL